MSRIGFGGARSLIAALVLMLISAPAWAVDGPQPIRIQYAAPAGCPDALEFFGDIRARTDRVRLAEATDLAEPVQVTIEQGATRSVGTLEMPPVGGEPFTRRVEAASCKDVVLALALVVALAHDPDAMLTPAGPATAPPAPSPVAPPPLPVAPLPVVPEKPPAPLFRAAVGVDERFMSSVAPTLRPTIAPFLEFGASGSRIWRPRVVATVLVEAPEAVVRTAAGSATLGFVGAGLAACPVSARLSGVFELDPCLGFELGTIQGSGGSDVARAHSDSTLWSAIEGFARFRWNAVGTLFVQASGGGGVTLVRGSFALALHDPNPVPVYSVPAGFGEFALGIGVYFL